MPTGSPQYNRRSPYLRDDRGQAEVGSVALRFRIEPTLRRLMAAGDGGLSVSLRRLEVADFKARGLLDLLNERRLHS